MQSKAGKPLTRYFPKLVVAARALGAPRFVLDGEIVVPTGNAFSFDALLQRIHPAASRVSELAAETPAMMIVFDLLAVEGGALLDRPLAERRGALEQFASEWFRPGGSFRLSPISTDRAQAQRWLKGVGARLDGIVAKRRDLPYQAGERTGMQKVKNYRSADCVVGGLRYGAGKRLVGSLLLGLYDAEGLLQHVGFTSAIQTKDKRALTERLEKLIAPPGFTGAQPGGPSRWATARSAEWKPLAPRIVVEVTYDHFTDGGFRHGTRLMRFRPDKAPAQCTMDQVEQRANGLVKLLD